MTSCHSQSRRTGYTLLRAFIIDGISPTALDPSLANVFIPAPTNSGSWFHNYKGTFSIILLAVVDAEYCFWVTDAGGSGQNSDGGTLSNSRYLLHPFPGSNIAREDLIYNYRLSHARLIVKCNFGILSSQWQMYRRVIEVGLDKKCCKPQS
eukprot:superscaffoldBa00000064_g1049